MSTPGGWLDALVRLGMTQPVTPPVPADDAHFLASKGRLRVAQRVVKQRLELALGGQRGLRRERIEAGWRRAVWFHAEAPQIGDALMDLAPRSLLAERGIAVSLIAPAATAALFRGDRGFAAVSDEPRSVDPGAFDFAIVDSDSAKALAGKRQYAPRLPWVSVRSAYLGYDFQRGLLATRRFADWLGVRLAPADEAQHAAQKLLVDGAVGRHAGHAAAAGTATGGRPAMPAAALTGDGIRVAIALGGVRAERSYRRWPAVARQLAATAPCRFVLLGSANARVDRDAFLHAAAEAPALQVVDRVGATSLHEAAQAIAECTLALCADGGLMHLALTTPTPLLALFDASVDPAWRLPTPLRGKALRADQRDVNGLDPADVAAAALACMEATSRIPRA